MVKSMSQEPRGIDDIGPPRRSAQFLRNTIKARGWLLIDLAFWLGLSRQHLHDVIADVHRSRHWDLALEHVPRLTRLEMRTITALRLAAHPPAVVAPATQAVPTGPGFRYHGVLEVGAIVIAATTLEDLAEEGEEGWVAEVRQTGEQEEYRVRFAGGEDWFDPPAVDRYLVETGRMR